MLKFKQLQSTLKKRYLSLLSVMLLILTLSACSTIKSPTLIPPEKINPELLRAPIQPSLLIPCRLSYPFRELSPESDLEGLYKTFIYNLGQAEKCYNKDESLIENIKNRENNTNKDE